MKIAIRRKNKKNTPLKNVYMKKSSAKMYIT